MLGGRQSCPGLNKREVRVMSYEKQAIIAILTGEGDADNVITSSCEDLREKWFYSHNNSYDNCHGVFLQMQNIVATKLGRYMPDWNDEELVKLKDLLPQVDKTWRLYIIGHGNWKTASCGDVRGPEMAKLLLDGGLRSVGLISLIACRGAYLYSPPGARSPRADRKLERLGPGGTYWFPPSATTGFLHCFAGDFHYSLGKGFELPEFQVDRRRRLRRLGAQGTYWYPSTKHVEVRTTVYARVGVISVGGARTPIEELEDTDRVRVLNKLGVKIRGRKATSPNELLKEELDDNISDEIYEAALAMSMVHKRPGSKIAYTWKGDKQVRSMVNYDTAALYRYERVSELKASFIAKLKKLREARGPGAVDDFLRKFRLDLKGLGLELEVQRLKASPIPQPVPGIPQPVPQPIPQPVPAQPVPVAD
jgi:hypothetical protein